jgi:hypothetical protein
VRALLAELHVDVFERAGEVQPEEARAGWDLVVATSSLVPDLDGLVERRPTCIAVVQDASRTLSARLRRAGVDYVVRRPVHPTALRLLFTRALYRGPERRRHRRVPIGASIVLEQRLRRSGVLLVDLSQEGCRIELDQTLKRGDRVTLLIPRAVTAGRRLVLRAEVLRMFLSQETGARQATLRFPALSARRAARLAQLVDQHSDGPALAPEAADACAELGSERRRFPRHAFSRKVIALGDQAARVLVGRDLSLGGMRVEPNAALRVGETLRLAIHGGDGTPAVVEAEVVRDEGKRGYVLRFAGVGEAERVYLESLLGELPTLSDPREEKPEDLVVSELLP